MCGLRWSACLWFLVALGGIGDACLGQSVPGNEDRPGAAARTSPGVPAESSDADGSGRERTAVTPELPPAVDSGAAVPRIYESPLTVQVPSKEGALDTVFLPGFPLDLFNRLYWQHKAMGESSANPGYSIQSVAIEGQVLPEPKESPRARLDIAVEIVATQAEPMMVPLRLDEGVMTSHAEDDTIAEAVDGAGADAADGPKGSDSTPRAGGGDESQSAPFRYEGPGQAIPVGGDSQRGYYCYLDPKEEGTTHRIQLRMLVPLVQTAGENRLKLSLPTSVRSSISLRVPEASPVVEANDGTLLRWSAVADGGGTEIVATGLRPDFEMIWRPETLVRSQARPVVKVEGATILADLTREAALMDVSLPVRAYGGKFQRFTIQLPSDAEWSAEESASAVTLRELPRRDSEPTLLDVQLTAPTDETVLVRFQVRVPPTTPEGGHFALRGFGVLDADVQSGHIVLRTSEDWLLRWDAQERVRRVARVPGTASNGEDGFIAGFAFSSQPFLLEVDVERKETRVSVKPEYQLLVDQDQVTLTGSLRFVVRGKEAEHVRFSAPTWHVQHIGPSNQVAANSVSEGEGGQYHVPLRYPIAGELSVQFTAYRSISDSDAVVDFVLPRPHADWVEPATVVVLPADNVELQPDDSRSVGLTRLRRQQVAPRMAIPERDQDPLFYRGQTSGSTWAAKIIAHERRVLADMAGVLDLTLERSQIEQTIQFDVRYEALDWLTLAFPPDLDEQAPVEVLLEGKTLPLGEPSDAPANSPVAGRVLRRVKLPEPELGTFALTVRFDLPPVDLQPEATSYRPFGLVVPVDADVLSNQLRVRSDAPIDVIGVASDTRWEASGHAASRLASQDEVLRLSSDEATEDVLLVLRLEDRTRLTAPVLEKAWIQTRLTSSQRGDRAVFRIADAGSEVQIEVPEAVELDDVRVRVDGQRVVAEMLPQSRLRVPIGSDAPSGDVLVEVGYVIPRTVAPFSGAEISLPRLADRAWARRIYWQLVMPRYEHLISSPENMTAEYQWSWNGVFWGREPTMTEAELQTWIGAPAANTIAEATSCYLFSSFGCVERCQIHVASRSTIILVASGAVLVLGLALIYVPGLRGPASMFILLIVFISLVAYQPAPAFLFVQAASLGVVLTIVAFLLQRSIGARGRRWHASDRESGLLDKGSSHTEPAVRLTSGHVFFGSSQGSRMSQAAGSGSASQEGHSL